MATQTIDYAALADQARKTAPVDYAALADQARKVAAPPEEKSLYQRAKDSFNAETQAAKPGDNVVTRTIQEGFHAVGDAVRAAAHPIDTITNAVVPAVTDATVGLLTSKGRQKMLDKLNPITQGANLVKGVVANPGYAAGQLVTGLVGGKILGAAGEAIPKAAGAVEDAAVAAKQYARPTSSPAIVPPEEIQAQKIAQSILPPGGIKPEFLKAVQAEAPALVEYAQRTGNPLNTQAEALKAARGVAEEGRQHFNTEVRDPVAGRSVALDPQNTSLGDKATIGQIDQQITDLNHKIDTGGAKSQGAALDVEAKSKWTKELQYLRGKYYSALEHTTGIPATQLLELREGYGGSYTLADNLEAAMNDRLTRTGKVSQGVKPIGSIPTGMAEIPGKALQVAKGGEQAIADRQFASAIKQVQPQAPIRPTPPPIDTDALAAQQAQAQQEFLRAHQSEQAAQDASAQRSVVADDARVRNAAQMRAKALAEFEARKVAGEKARQQSYERSKTR